MNEQFSQQPKMSQREQRTRDLINSSTTDKASRGEKHRMSNDTSLRQGSSASQV